MSRFCEATLPSASTPLPESSNLNGHQTGKDPSALNTVFSRLSRGISHQSIIPTLDIRKVDFGFLPIPKSRRHDRNLKPEEQFIFTWRMNLVFAGAAVRLLSYIFPVNDDHH